MYVYIYIYIYTGVCEKNTPREKKTTRGRIGYPGTKSGAREQFMLLDCVANARLKGVFVHRRRYRGRLRQNLFGTPLINT